MAEAPLQPSSDPSTPPHETNQIPKNKKNRGTKKPKRAAAASSGATMVEDHFLVLAGGKEGGARFLELEEIDEADFGIIGGVVEDVGAGERKVGKDEKNKNKKRKRGDYGQSLGGAGDGDLVAERVEEGEKGEKNAKRNRNRKKRKVKNKEKDVESKEDVVGE